MIEAEQLEIILPVVLYRHSQEWEDGRTEKAGGEGFIKLYHSR